MFKDKYSVKYYVMLTGCVQQICNQAVVGVCS